MICARLQGTFTSIISPLDMSAILTFSSLCMGYGPGRYLCWALTPCKLLAICVLVTYLYLGQPVFPLPA